VVDVHAVEHGHDPTQSGHWDRKTFGESKATREHAKTLKDAKTTYLVRHRIDGRQVSKGFARKVDAENYAASVQVNKLQGTTVDPQRSKITIEDYGKTWLARRKDLGDNTRELYHHLLTKHIIPSLGSTTVGGLTISAVRAWHAGIAQEHAVTAAKAYRLLRTIMNAAVDDHLRFDNPCRVKGAGSEPETDRPTASVDEVTALASAMPERLRLVVLLATWTQLRRGEILGLRRRDVDLLHEELKVTETEVITLSRQRIRKGPKSKAGKRRLSIPDNIVADVKAHLDRYVDKDPDAALFTCTYYELRGAWERARKSIRRPDLHLHDLRGTGLTLAVIAGATTSELMYRAGHSTPAMAMRYQKATKDRDRMLAGALAGLAKPEVPTSPAK
jgi:integrase